MLWVDADNAYNTFALDNFALLTHFLNRSAYFHFGILPSLVILRSLENPLPVWETRKDGQRRKKDFPRFPISNQVYDL